MSVGGVLSPSSILLQMVTKVSKLFLMCLEIQQSGIISGQINLSLKLIISPGFFLIIVPLLLRPCEREAGKDPLDAPFA